MAAIKRCNIKKGDQVVVIAGKDFNKFVRKGAAAERVPHRGRVLDVSPTKGKVKVEGAGMIKKHQRANPQNNRGGGIIEREAWIDISNVQLIDPETGRPTRVKYEKNADGTKTRIAVRSGRGLDK
ncbi:MAG: 50S ribosomal protein L24 [Pyrinomonadaceae bacterium]